MPWHCRFASLSFLPQKESDKEKAPSIQLLRRIEVAMRCFDTFYETHCLPALVLASLRKAPVAF